MDKGIQDLLDKLSLDTATYNINAVGYPSMIILRDDLRRVLDYIYKLQQQLKKKDEVIKELTKNENSNNFLKDSLKLQIEFNKLLKKNNVTMIDLRNLCIPFRDKYNFTDHQTLRIAREEVAKEELLQILEDKEVG